SVAFPAPGRVVAMGHEIHSSSVVLWDVGTGKVLAGPGGHHGHVTSLRFAGPDRLMAASMDGEISTWDLTGRELARTRPRPGDDGKLTHLHFSPGGRWVAGDVEGVRAVHNLTSGKRVWTALEKGPGHQFGNTESSFSGDDSI